MFNLNSKINNKIPRYTRATPSLLFALVIFSGTSSCQKKEASIDLPPLEGENAPPKAVIPEIEEKPALATAQSNDRFVVTGTVQPIKEAKLGPKSTGTIAAMLVEEGDKVKKGQVLFRLDKSQQSLAVKQAQAALNSAKVAQNTAETDLARTKALYDNGSVAPAVYDQMKARFDATEAAVEQAKAAVAQAKQSIIDTTVRSPISGVISARLSNTGETVTLMPPSVVLIVQDISKLEVRGRAPETMLKRLKPGTEIEVRFPSVDITRRVAIERINPSVDPRTRTVEVVALLPNQDGSLKAGMLTEMDFGAYSEDATPVNTDAAAQESSSEQPSKPLLEQNKPVDKDKKG